MDPDHPYYRLPKNLFIVSLWFKPSLLNTCGAGRLAETLEHVRKAVVAIESIGIDAVKWTTTPKDMSKEAEITIRTMLIAASAFIALSEHKNTKEAFALLDTKGPKYWLDELPPA